MKFKKSYSFFFSVFKDEIYAVRLAWQLNKYFPGVEVIAIADGPCDEHSLIQAKEFNTNLKIVIGERLKSSPTGGCRFTDRNFRLLLNESKSQIFIKLDPDSYILKSCEIPDYDWFGDVHNIAIPYLNYKFDFVAGGAMGLSRNTIAKILESDLLLDLKYDDKKGFYNRYQRYKKFGDPDNEFSNIRREDWVLGSVCKRLEINPVIWDEVYSNNESSEIIENYNSYSIIHPVRTRW